MKCILAAVLLLVAVCVSVEAAGYGRGYGSGSYYAGGYGHGGKAYVGPNILYGGYTLTSHSVSGPSK